MTRSLTYAAVVAALLAAIVVGSADSSAEAAGSERDPKSCPVCDQQGTPLGVIVPSRCASKEVDGHLLQECINRYGGSILRCPKGNLFVAQRGD